MWKHQVIGVPEGEQEIEELFEKIMTENFSNFMKERDMQPQEAQRGQKRWTQKGPHKDIS